MDLEKMEKWHTTVALMGCDVKNIYEWGDDDNFIELLEMHEEHLKRIERPSDTMRSVLLTTEMGITADEIDTYATHLCRIRDKELMDERDERIRTNPAILDLVEKREFKFVTSKQYPKHKHFTFKDKKGLEIRGRTFNPGWGKVRVWLSWRDSKNKLQHQVHNYRTNDDAVAYPKGFPRDWTDDGYYSYSISTERVPYIIAHRIVERKLKSGTYPKA